MRRIHQVMRQLGLLGAVAAVGCSDPDGEASVEQREGNVTIFTQQATVKFIDTGVNIAIVELTPEDVPSAAEEFIVDGGTPEELFYALAPQGAVKPPLLQTERAKKPIGEETTNGFRAWGYDGVWSSCRYRDSESWADAIEELYPGYDEYFHIGESEEDLVHYTPILVKRQYATLCPIESRVLNTPSDDTLNYRGWRQEPGGAWNKWVDEQVPVQARLRHWDDPGADGYRWAVYVDDVEHETGCSIVCNDGKHHTSHMWDR